VTRLLIRECVHNSIPECVFAITFQSVFRPSLLQAPRMQLLISMQLMQLLLTQLSRLIRKSRMQLLLQAPKSHSTRPSAKASTPPSKCHMSLRTARKSASKYPITDWCSSVSEESSFASVRKHQKVYKHPKGPSSKHTTGPPAKRRKLKKTTDTSTIYKPAEMSTTADESSAAEADAPVLCQPTRPSPVR
jgi:hypothetical protein